LPEPKGAKPASGKGSIKASAILIKGKPPKKPLFRDTGAVDDIITASKGGIVVRSVKDKRYIPRAGDKTKVIRFKQTNVSGGIEVDKQGKGHIKL